MIVVIDNYDSFVFNLVQYLGVLGADLQVFRNDAVTVDDVARLRPRGIVISPGPGTPDQAGISVPLIRELAPSVPILGVCLGHQALGAAYGAVIVRGRSVVHGKTARIHHDGQNVFTDLPNPFEATRYHSLVIDPDTLPDCLAASATSADGVLMGIRHRTFPAEGVQFHPESILTAPGMQLISNWLDSLHRTPGISSPATSFS